MMISLLFERPITLLVVCAVIESMIARYWARTRSTSASRVAVIGLLATIALPAISVLVVTNRERIEQTCREAGMAVDDGNLNAIGDLLEPSFNSEGIDRDEFLRHAGEILTRYRVDRVHLRNFDVHLSEDAYATATFDATCAVRSADTYADAVPTRWQLHFRRSGDRWLITEVRSIPVPPFFIRTISQWEH